jgi:hypothetical protein
MKAKLLVAVWALTIVSTAKAEERYRAYPGPPLPRKLIGICKCASLSSLILGADPKGNGYLLKVTAVDGHPVASYWDGSARTKTFSEIELLPGPHTLTYQYSGPGELRSNDFDVSVQAGKTYWLRAREEITNQSTTVDPIPNTRLDPRVTHTEFIRWFEIVEVNWLTRPVCAICAGNTQR